MSIDVSVVRMDDLLATRRPPLLAKIDAEGAEASILNGADRLLETVRPAFLIEVSAPCGPEVAALLRAMRYRLFDAEVPPAARVPIQVPAFNTLALPGE